MYYENYSTQRNLNDYEYATVNTTNQYASLYEECYFSAGWSQGISESVKVSTSKNAPLTLNFKRPREYARNFELVQLQESCENTISRIIDLKSGKETKLTLTTTITFIACIVTYGIINSVICDLITPAPAVFTMIPVFMSFGLIGFLIWGPKYVQKKVHSVASLKTDSILHAEYNKFDSLCKKLKHMINPE